MSLSLRHAQSCDEVWLVTFILLSQQCVCVCLDRNRPKCASLCMHFPAFLWFFSLPLTSQHICHMCFNLHSVQNRKTCAIWTSYSFQILHSVWFARSVNLPLLRSHDLCIELSQSRRQLVSNRPLLARAKGKMTFLCCLFWEGNRKNARAAVLFLLADPTPVNSSLPLQRHSPYSHSGFGCSRVLYSVNNTSSESSKLLWQ